MLRIIKPGLLTTIQDTGRNGYHSQAVPLSGCMDTLSAQLANCAVGNQLNAALIEFTYGDAAFIAEEDMLIAVSGAGAELLCDHISLPPERPLFIPAGTILSLFNNGDGCRTYLAMAGGCDVPEILGSRSTYLLATMGGLEGRRLRTNDRIPYARKLEKSAQVIWNALRGNTISFPGWSIARSLFLPPDRKTIRIVPGREWLWFTTASVKNFLSQPFTLSLKSNRMGICLDGEPMQRTVHDELISTAVCPGTIQVAGNGSLILLMADCQITGGYPRIAHVASTDLALCAQLKPGDKIRFREITMNEAENLYIEQHNQLRNLQLAITKRYGVD